VLRCVGTRITAAPQCTFTSWRSSTATGQYRHTPHNTQSNSPICSRPSEATASSRHTHHHYIATTTIFIAIERRAMSTGWRLELNGGSQGMNHHPPTLASKANAAPGQLFGLDPSTGQFTASHHHHHSNDSSSHPELESMFGALGIDGVDSLHAESFLLSSLQSLQSGVSSAGSAGSRAVLGGLQGSGPGTAQDRSQQQPQLQAQPPTSIGSRAFGRSSSLPEGFVDSNPNSFGNIIGGHDHLSEKSTAPVGSIQSDWGSHSAQSEKVSSSSPLIGSVSTQRQKQPRLYQHPPYSLNRSNSSGGSMIRNPAHHSSQPFVANGSSITSSPSRYSPSGNEHGNGHNQQPHHNHHHQQQQDEYIGNFGNHQQPPPTQQQQNSTMGFRDVNSDGTGQHKLSLNSPYFIPSTWDSGSNGSADAKDRNNSNHQLLPPPYSSHEHGAPPHEELKTSLSPILQPVQVQIIPSGQTIYMKAATPNQGCYTPREYQPYSNGQQQQQQQHHRRHKSQPHQQQELPMGEVRHGSRVDVHARYMSPMQLHENNYSGYPEYNQSGQSNSNSSGGHAPQAYIVVETAEPVSTYDGQLHHSLDLQQPHHHNNNNNNHHLQNHYQHHHHHHHHQQQQQQQQHRYRHHGQEQQQQSGFGYGGANHHHAHSRERGHGRSRRNQGTSPRRQTSLDSRYRTDSLLDTFKANRNRDWTVLDIKGHVPEFCQDQNGSRFIQQRLEIGDQAEKQRVLQEVLEHMERLRNDVFGNYVVQKLFDFGTLEMKSDLCASLKGDMVHLSLQMYGCRVVQKALEVVDEHTMPSLLDEFKEHVLDCIYDQNGNHVVQKCIEVIHKRSRHLSIAGEAERASRLDGHIDFIINDVLSNVTSLSCHPYGCRVLQRILEHCDGDRKKSSLTAIRSVHRTLLDDQYGNYVIQHVLHYGTDIDRDSVLSIVVENGLLKLSRQKFASNVVEKLLKHGSQKHRRALVREMLKKDRSGASSTSTTTTTSSSTSSSSSSLSSSSASVSSKDVRKGGNPQDDKDASVVLFMVRDAYANYVVQTALDVLCECDEKRQLLQELNAHSTELRNYTFAKHIVTKLAS